MPPEPDPTAQARRMLARCRHECSGPDCRISSIQAGYVFELGRQLPDVDPAVIGRVVMAAVAAATEGIRTVRPRVRDDYEAHEGALAILGATGAQMYLDTAQESSTHAPASPL